MTTTTTTCNLLADPNTYPCNNCGRLTTGTISAYAGGRGYVTVGMCRADEGCSVDYRNWMLSTGRVPLAVR